MVSGWAYTVSHNSGNLKITSYFTSKMSLFGDGRRIALRDMQALGSRSQVEEASRLFYFIYWKLSFCLGFRRKLGREACFEQKFTGEQEFAVVAVSH